MAKRSISMFVAVALAFAVFAGCTGAPIGGGEESSEAPAAASSSAAETAEPADESSPAEDITMRFSWWGGDVRHEATLKAIDLYKTRFPNITIEAEYGGYDGYLQKLTTQLAGGSEPDIMQVDHPWLPTFAATGDYFVDAFQHQDILDLSGYDQQFLADYAVFDGKLMGPVVGINGMTFLANKAVLDEAGITFGETITWDDIIEAGKKMQESNPDHYLLALDSATGGVINFVIKLYIYQLTGKPLLNGWEPGFTQEELTQAFAVTKNIYEQKAAIPWEEAILFAGAMDKEPRWASNRVGGWLNWASNSILQDWGEDAIALPYPVIAAGTNPGVITRPALALCVSKNTPYVKEAFSFINFLLNDEDAILILGDTRSVPANEKARNLLNENNLVSKVVMDGVNWAIEHPLPTEVPFANDALVNDAFFTPAEKMIYGTLSVEEAAQESYEMLINNLEILKNSVE